jgi:DNA-directed RNA polymerase specialized sigma subunit
MKIKITDHLHGTEDIVGYAFIVAMCSYEEDNPCCKIEDSPYHSEDGVFDVQLLINGTEVPFDAVLQAYKSQFNRMLNERAQELLLEKAQNISDLLYKVECNLKEAANELFPTQDDQWG